MNMDNESFDSEREELLEYAATKASRLDFFLASALSVYRQAESLDEAGLAVYLGIDPAQLSRLGLCHRPDPTDQASFRQDVLAIASRFTINPPGLLANLLRRVAALEAENTRETQFSPTRSNYLMAARDRSPEEDEEDPPAADQSQSDA